MIFLKPLNGSCGGLPHPLEMCQRHQIFSVWSFKGFCCTCTYFGLKDLSPWTGAPLGSPVMTRDVFDPAGLSAFWFYPGLQIIPPFWHCGSCQLPGGWEQAQSQGYFLPLCGKVHPVKCHSCLGFQFVFTRKIRQKLALHETPWHVRIDGKSFP